MTRSQAGPDYGYPFISSLRLEHFKSVASAEVELSPLTLLVGVNSSGKSNILQAIRIIQQGITSYPERALDLKFGMFRLDDERLGMSDILVTDATETTSTGLSLSNVRTVNTRSSSPIILGIELVVPNLNEGLAWELSLDSHTPYNRATSRVFVMGLRIRRFHVQSHDTTISLSLDRSERLLDTSVQDQLDDLLDRKDGRIDKVFQSSIDELYGQGLGDIITPDLVNQIRQDLEHVVTHERLTLEKLLSFRGFRCLVVHPSLVREPRELVLDHIDDLYPDSLSDQLNSPFSNSDTVTPSFRRIFGNIYSLGPLRHDQRVVIDERKDASGDRRDHVGWQGQFTPLAIRTEGHKMVMVPLPGSSASEEVSLIEAVRAWIANIGLVDDVSTRGDEVRPRGVDSYLPLTWVGSGVSQMLPVLVLCLLAEPGSVILLEQPELHLHPALQQRLADFFIAIAGSGRQLIVETHSEYVVSRLRRRIVEDPDDKLLGMTKVIFAERDRQTGLSSFRDVELTPYGDIDEWPQGFFDQAGEEERAIILGGLRKRRKHAERSE